jgi:hypothetical protein
MMMVMHTITTTGPEFEAHVEVSTPVTGDVHGLAGAMDVLTHERSRGVLQGAWMDAMLAETRGVQSEHYGTGMLTPPADASASSVP